MRINDIMIWGNNYLKKLSINFFINFICAFILLSLFAMCIYQNLTEKSLFKWFCKKIYTHESVWKGNAYGDLSAYSVFLKENLFKDDFYGHILVMPGLNRTNPKLFYSFRPDFPSFYLFPVEIEMNNGYEFVLEENVFNKLSKLPLITKMYGEAYEDNLSRRYCLVQGVKANDYKKWAIYAFLTRKTVNIFTLPMDWHGFKDSD